VHGGASATCTLSNVQSAKTVSATFTAIPNYVPTGPVVQIVYDPTTPTTLYSALDGGGVFKSSDSGVNWDVACGQPANLNLVSLAIDASGKLYAGSEAGVFVSSDSCASWTAMSAGLPCPTCGLLYL
jgi:hypothetical protein